MRIDLWFFWKEKNICVLYKSYFANSYNCCFDMISKRRHSRRSTPSFSPFTDSPLSLVHRVMHTEKLKGAKRRLLLDFNFTRRNTTRTRTTDVTAVTWKKRSVHLRRNVSLSLYTSFISLCTGGPRGWWESGRRREGKGNSRRRWGMLWGKLRRKTPRKCESSARHNRRNVSRAISRAISRASTSLPAFDRY